MKRLRWVIVLAALATASVLSSITLAQTPQQMDEYRRKLAEYTAVRQQFDEKASAYWSTISDKRRARNANGPAWVLSARVGRTIMGARSTAETGAHLLWQPSNVHQLLLLVLQHLGHLRHW